MPAGHDEDGQWIGIRAVGGDGNRAMARSAAQAPTALGAARLRCRDGTWRGAPRVTFGIAALRLLPTRDEFHHLLTHS